jgi:tripartite-type tricarboxylate transporter receptor subunit TctC
MSAACAVNGTFNKAMEQPGFKNRVGAPGAQPIGGRPAVFQTMINDDAKLWGEVIRKAKTQVG